MLNRTAYANNRKVCLDDEYLNVYVTEDKITVRILRPYDNPDNSMYVPFGFSMLNSHDNIPLESLPESNPRGVFIDNAGNSYIIDRYYNIELSEVIEWYPYSEISICMFEKDIDRFKRSFSSYNKLLSFDVIPRTYLNKKLVTDGNNNFYSNYRVETQLTRFLDFVVYKSGLNFLTCPMRLVYNKLLYTNVEFDHEGDCRYSDDPSLDAKTWLKETFCPRFKFDDSVTEIPADGRITLNVECYNNAGLDIDDRSFQLEAISGYLPHKRLDIVDSKGSFDVIAMGLQPGDQLRIKVNDRFYTSRGEKILTVV